MEIRKQRPMDYMVLSKAAVNWTKSSGTNPLSKTLCFSSDLDGSLSKVQLAVSSLDIPFNREQNGTNKLIGNKVHVGREGCRLLLQCSIEGKGNLSKAK